MGTEQYVVCMVQDRFFLCGKGCYSDRLLWAGDVIELFLEGQWQAVRVCSGGYKGWYYQTVSGVRGRFAGCMRARVLSGQTWEQCQRAYWVGRSVRSRVLFGGRCVQGVVQELTERGKVVFVYRVPLSEVAVRVVFPVERVADVLAA